MYAAIRAPVYLQEATYTIYRKKTSPEVKNANENSKMS